MDIVAYREGVCHEKKGGMEKIEFLTDEKNYKSLSYILYPSVL